MNLVLMRHPERRKDCVEAQAGLTEEGLEAARETAFAIAAPIPSFDLVLRSDMEAAKQASEQFQHAGCIEAAGIKVSCVLAPAQDTIRFADIESQLKGVHNAAIIGHHPGITNLLKDVTGRECRTIERGEAIWVEMHEGKGIIRNTFGSTHTAELLREKVQMKLTVSTFLAGFNIPVLVELVKDGSQIFAIHQIAATILFTIGFCLFVVAVYMYDELLMPSQFWGPVEKRKQPKNDSDSGFAHNYRLNGRRYAYMVRTWNWIFTPAVACSALGFVSLIVGKWSQPNARWVVFACLLAILTSVGIYNIWRPRLGIED